MKLLGLDVGTNSVGSAWVDTKKQIIHLGVSVFPAGVEESEQKRGAPKNQARRQYRIRRRSIQRRATRKRQLRKFLVHNGWVPTEPTEYKRWLDVNPWILRDEGLSRELTRLEFGRILLHIAQRRGAYGFDSELGQEEEGKLKEAVDRTRQEISARGVATFGQLMAVLSTERRVQTGGRCKPIRLPIRNRKSASGEPVYEFCADRQLIRQEFDAIWRNQQSFKGHLAQHLTSQSRAQLDDPGENQTWRHGGLLFGQRKTYWKTESLGRCDLEPTDLRCPRADMYAQEFLVLETVNNIAIIPPGQTKRRLNEEERLAVLQALRRQKTATAATVRRALGLHKGEKKRACSLSVDADPRRRLNTDWFYREIVLRAVGESSWESMSSQQRESVNRALIKFDPKSEQDRRTLQAGCYKWWGMDEGKTEALLNGWAERPRIDDRLQLSRRAIRNLLPYIREDGLTVNEARKRFANDPESGATPDERARYGFGATKPSRSTRRYQEKHPGVLPPAPMLTNPVVRKAIHEVRRHVQAYLRRFGKPDRVTVELARDARLPARVRNHQLTQNRLREKERKRIIEQFDLQQLTKGQRDKAVRRVLLCREQRLVCAYSGKTITETMAVRGESLEVDHIVPQSRGGDSYLSNLLLCFVETNRGKGSNTPKEWLSDEEFRQMERRLGHLKKDSPRKWENLHRVNPDPEDFVQSQLTDTAYAASQVARWLRETLYDGERDGKRHVFTTRGRYTPWLRRDWCLYVTKCASGGGQKERSDHREHALDALAIALSGPQRLVTLQKAVEDWELSKADGTVVPKRKRLPPPWGDFESFRSLALARFNEIVVAHRPAKRRIAGALHKDTQYGPIPGSEKLATKRIFAIELTPNHLRVPKGWEELRKELEVSSSGAGRRTIRKRMLALEDVKPTMSGFVRDRWFREEIRSCLRSSNLDPDDFTRKDIRDLVRTKGILLSSGVPVRRITLLRAPTTVCMKRKRPDTFTGELGYDSNPRALRIYEPQNNHHIEVREDQRGVWIGEVVTNFEAAGRVRPAKSSGCQPQPAVDRNDNETGRFVMSLSIGEIVHMRHPGTNKPKYLVVFKIDSTGTVHFTPHWDGGRSKAIGAAPAREHITRSVRQLQTLGPTTGTSPRKVWVGPLGDVKLLRED